MFTENKRKNKVLLLSVRTSVCSSTRYIMPNRLSNIVNLTCSLLIVQVFIDRVCLWTNFPEAKVSTAAPSAIIIRNEIDSIDIQPVYSRQFNVYFQVFLEIFNFQITQIKDVNWYFENFELPIFILQVYKLQKYI